MPFDALVSLEVLLSTGVGFEVAVLLFRFRQGRKFLVRLMLILVGNLNLSKWIGGYIISRLAILKWQSRLAILKLSKAPRTSQL